MVVLSCFRRRLPTRRGLNLCQIRAAPELISAVKLFHLAEIPVEGPTSALGVRIGPRN
jgi:hypothetical protein